MAEISDDEKRQFLLDILARIDEKIASTSDLNDIFQEACEGAARIFSAVNASVLLIDYSSKFVYPVRKVGRRWIKSAEKRYLIGKVGITGHVAKYKKPVRIGNVNVGKWKKKYHPVVKGTQSEMASPILNNDDNSLIGVFNVESTKLDAYTKLDEELLVRLTRHLATACKIFQQSRIVHLLRGIDSAIIEWLSKVDDLSDADNFSQRLLELLLEAVDAKHGHWMKLDPKEANEMMLVAEKGVPESSKRWRQPILIGIMGSAIRELITVIVDDTRKSKTYINLGTIGNIEMLSEMAVPLQTKQGEPKGVINAEKPETFGFSKFDAELWEVAAPQIVIALSLIDQVSAMKIERDHYDQLKNLANEIKDKKTEEEILAIAIDAIKRRTYAIRGIAWREDTRRQHLEHFVEKEGKYKEFIHDKLPLDPIPPALLSVNAKAWNSKHSVFNVPDVSNPPEGTDFGNLHTFTKSILIVAVVLGDSKICQLDFRSDRLNGFSPEHEDFACLVAGLAANSIMRIRAETDLNILLAIQSGSTLSHTLRHLYIETQRNAIRGILSRGALTSDLVTLLSNLEHTLDRILHMSNAVDIAETNFKPQLVSELLKVIEDDPQLKNNPLIKVEGLDKIPAELRVNCIDAVRTAIWNVYENATRMSGSIPGGVRINVSAVVNGTNVLIRISDNGPGIPKDQEELIFQWLKTGHGETGTGRGLALARYIVEYSDGAIWAENNDLPSPGASFFIKLRVA